MSAMDPKQFRQACGQFLTGVTIVTTRGADGQPAGVVANSFTSVSLNPPMVLVCVDKNVSSYPAFQAASGYAVHILAAEQQELSTRFTTKGIDRFAGLDLTTNNRAVPIIPDCLAVLECRVAQCHECGDHTIFIGEVENLQVAAEPKPPLGFQRGRYVNV